jgi:hypothetical protein
MCYLEFAEIETALVPKDIIKLQDEDTFFKNKKEAMLIKNTRTLGRYEIKDEIVYRLGIHKKDIEKVE